MRSSSAIAALVALLGASGCAPNLGSMRGVIVGGGPPLVFWPPPEPTSTWRSTRVTAGASLGTEVDRLASALDAAGYRDTRWYSIGPRYVHGFVVTTRLERVRPDATPAVERWSPAFPDAANLFWLEARDGRVPDAGKYQVLLVAMSDLPSAKTNLAQPWSEHTVLIERPTRRDVASGTGRELTERDRLDVYVYEYEGSAPGVGSFVIEDEALPVPVRIERAGLGALTTRTR